MQKIFKFGKKKVEFFIYSYEDKKTEMESKFFVFFF